MSGRCWKRTGRALFRPILDWELNMRELTAAEIECVGGAGPIYIGPDGAPWRDGMPIYISLDQLGKTL